MPIIFLLLILLLVFIIIRYIFICSTRPCKSSVINKNISSMFVLGSGGHTTEMIEIVKNLKPRFNPKVFVVANSDSTSENKLIDSNIIIEKIPRSREVKQSFFTSIFTTLYSIIFSLRVVWSHKPELIVCNGPGTCIPICFWGFILKIFWLSSCKIIYVESICRVTSLSLSGLIIYYTKIYDTFYVHWSELKALYPKTILKFSK